MSPGTAPRIALALAMVSVPVFAPSNARAMGICFSTTTPTVQVSVSPSAPSAGGAATLTCTASGGSVASLTVTVSDGTLGAGGTTASLTGTSGQIDWNTPALAGSYTVQCDAVPGDSCTNPASSGPVSVSIGGAATPVIDSLQGPTAPVLAGQTVSITATAHDPFGGPLAYQWSADGGSIAGSGATVSWTAPSTSGGYTISLTVTGASGTANSSIAASVVLAAFEGSVGAQLRAPSRVAVGPGGQIYVVDASDGTLAILGANGSLIGSVALPDRALAVAVGPAIFVSTQGGAIYRVDPASGRGLPVALRDGPLSTPSGLSWDATNGLLWVAERGANRVRALRPDGSTALLIGAAGTTPLTVPVDVAVQPGTGLVWVALQANETGNLLHAFSSTTGAYAASYVTFGGGPGQVARAGGVAAGADRVFVSDIFQGQVQVLSTIGVSLGTIGSFGTSAGQLRIPAGLAVAPNGDLLVANMDLARVDRFGAGSAPPATCTVNGQLDSDCDGMPDAWEIAYGLNPFWAGDALLDADGDGLTNLQEFRYGTNPRNPDTDGDGIPDGVEVALGMNPLDPSDGKPQLVAGGPTTSDPGLVRLGASLQGREPCTVAWKQLDGLAVTLRDADTLTPSFVGRTAARYRFQGVATCGRSASDPAVLVATVRNVAPIADAGRDVVTSPNRTVTLSGSFSSDANGDALTYAWEQVAGPATSLGARGQSLKVRPVAPGYYAYKLTATDPGGLQGEQILGVVVVDETLPTAIVKDAVLAATVGVPVTLDASASLPQGVTFSWLQVNGATQLDGPTPIFTPAAAGPYVFEVTAWNGALRSPPARVVVLAAAAALPTAVAIAPATGTLNAPLTLDGSASTGTTLSYRWRQLAGPAAGLSGADGAMPTVVPFATGSYVFELTVADASGAVSAPAVVRFSAVAPGKVLPVARATAPAGAQVGTLVILDGHASTGARNYRWTQVAGPWVPLDGANAIAVFHPAAAGTYGFELVVDDGATRSAPATVSVVVPEGSTP